MAFIILFYWVLVICQCDTSDMYLQQTDKCKDTRSTNHTKLLCAMGGNSIEKLNKGRKRLSVGLVFI